MPDPPDASAEEPARPPADLCLTLEMDSIGPGKSFDVDGVYSLEAGDFELSGAGKHEQLRLRQVSARALSLRYRESCTNTAVSWHQNALC